MIEEKKRKEKRREERKGKKRKEQKRTEKRREEKKARAHCTASHRIPSSAKRKQKKSQPHHSACRLCLSYLPTLRYLTSARPKGSFYNTIISHSSDEIHRSAVLWLLRTVVS